MAASTRTNRTPARTSRAGGAGQSRFARSGSSTRPTRSPGIARTSSSSSRTPALRRRRQQQPSGMKKVLGAVLPTGAAKKATPSSKKGKAGGLALVAAAAGMALKNRGKLSQLRQKDSGTQPDASFDTGMNNSPVSPTTPPA